MTRDYVVERYQQLLREKAMSDMPMSPRMYAMLIMERLRDGGIDVPLSDKDGYTVQDIITDHIKRAISDARRALEPKP